MATIALTVVGNAIAPGVGGAIGAALGGYIDSNYLLPALFPREDIGPRLDELKVSQQDEGAAVFFTMGPAIRVPCTCIWISQLREVKNEEEVGGSGGDTVVNYTYEVDIAYQVSDLGTRDGAIQSIDKVYAEGAALYTSDPDITITSDQIAATNSGDLGYWISVPNATPPSTYVTIEYYITLSCDVDVADLTQLRTGASVEISGFTAGAAVNNDSDADQKVTETWLDSGISYARIKRTNLEGFPANVAFVNKAAGDTVTLFQDLPNFNAAEITGISTYTGSQTGQDPLIVAQEGADRTPSYNGCAYFVVEGLQLNTYGNRVPFNFEALVKTDVTLSVGDAIARLIDRAAEFQNVSIDYDVSAVTGNLEGGYFVAGPQTLLSQLQPILLTYDILAQRRNNTLHFFNRTASDTITLDVDDLAAHVPGDKPDRPVRWFETSVQDKANEVNVKYQDPEAEYQAGSQRERRFRIASDSTEVVELPFTLSAQTARDVAARLLWTGWGDQPIELQLPASYLEILENDLLLFTYLGEDFRVRVDSVDRGKNGILLVKGISDTSSALADWNSPAEDPDSGSNGDVLQPPNITAFFIDLPNLIDSTLNTPGFYFAAAIQDTSQAFNGAYTFRSTDGGSSFTQILSYPQETTMGFTDGALADEPWEYWDRESELTVTLIDGALSSKTENQVLNGLNWAMIGPEIVGFTTVVDNGNFNYTISGLLRGRLGTGFATGFHSAAESFILLNSGGLVFYDAGASAIGVTAQYKTVAAGVDVSSVTANAYQFQGANMRPLPVANPKAARDSSGNITLTWNRRTRSRYRMFSGNTVPQPEGTESYEIDVLDGSDIVQRTLTATSETADYTAAQQTTDFGSTQAAVKFRFYQISDTVGRGSVREETL